MVTASSFNDRSNSMTKQSPRKSTEAELTSLKSLPDINNKGQSPTDVYVNMNMVNVTDPEQNDIDKHELGKHSRFKDGFSSLNYEIDESYVYKEFEKKRREKDTTTFWGKVFASGRDRAFLRWILTCSIAVFVNIVAIYMLLLNSVFSKYKTQITMSLIKENKIAAGFFFFWMYAIIFGTLAFFACCVEPSASGSGLPEAKVYLNGVELPRILRTSTLLSKSLGIVCSLVAGLPVGKEGPLIHCGAIVGGAVSAGKSKIFGYNTPWLRLTDFRNHREKRDFVCCGSASGVTAAFGAPVGGMLFALEEGASFFTQKLAWRAFLVASLTSLIALAIINIIESMKKSITSFDEDMIVSLNYFLPFPPYQLWNFIDLPFFFLIGAVGGLLGAAFNHCNVELMKFRRKNINTLGKKYVEVIIVVTMMAICQVFIPYSNSSQSNCNLIPSDETEYLVVEGATSMNQFLDPFLCNSTSTGNATYNSFSSLYFTSWDTCLRLLFHAPDTATSGTTGEIVPFFSYSALWALALPYFILSFLTFGTFVPAGLFIPTLINGASLGRLFGQVLQNIHWSDGRAVFARPGIYSLMGASAMLGGVTRIYISLTLILIECTQNLYFLFPIMVVLVTARFVGNIFNEGIYDMHIHLKGIPLLEAACPIESEIQDLTAGDVMTTDVVALPPIVQVETLYEILTEYDHNAFPLIDTNREPSSILQGQRGGSSTAQTSMNGGNDTVVGLIRRDYLVSLLYLKAFSESDIVNTRAPMRDPQSPIIEYEKIEQFYPNFPSAKDDIFLKEEDKSKWIDLRHYSTLSPACINQNTSLIKTYYLFRTMGLRHLLVNNYNNQLVGLLTRHDLTHHEIHESLEEYYENQVINFDKNDNADVIRPSLTKKNN